MPQPTEAFSYSHDDTGLIEQPIGYWSWAAHIAVVTHIRAGLAGFGLSQPQWWVLNQAAGDGRSREEITSILKGYLDVGDALQPDIDSLLERGLIAPGPTGLLRRTTEGEDLYVKARAKQREMRRTIHDGIDDEEFLTTMKVLQRMIHNTGGKAWHH
ncbi:MarR family winged helix-turn-helix transcriptional regulator [Streptomyces gamaensis]|uniref:MarR family winged helix-turn-helix transcriptional regulator n=1 Tax=Streptomyces gamaensis TaxID=1763542 RepID=A0ABW0Z987_9ACTN